MRRTPQERRNEIANLPTAELQKRLDEGKFGEMRSVALAELNARKSEDESARLARSEAREEAMLAKAAEANDIARQARNIAIAAAIIAVIAIALGK